MLHDIHPARPKPGHPAGPGPTPVRRVVGTRPEAIRIAPALGKPVQVCRVTAERPEAEAWGMTLFAATDAERVFAEAYRLLADPAADSAMARRIFPYGDGRAAARIATVLQQRVAARHGVAVVAEPA
jgi:UDP-N-acetylglucosamine 2-epimerase